MSLFRYDFAPAGSSDNMAGKQELGQEIKGNQTHKRDRREEK